MLANGGTVSSSNIGSPKNLSCSKESGPVLVGGGRGRERRRRRRRVKGFSPMVTDFPLVVQQDFEQ